MATMASNNHIGWSRVGVRENINSRGNSIEKIVNEWGQKLQRHCREGFGPLTMLLLLGRYMT